METKITLFGEPISTNSIYRYSSWNGHLHGYMSKEGKCRKDEYWWQFKKAIKKGWPLDSLYKVEIKLFFKNKRIHDIDNYNKIILDAATGFAWNDDKQIVELLISKAIDKENPRAEVLIHST